MKLEDFISLFIEELNKSNVKHCILRNYEGLPAYNSGNDIDFLIFPDDLDKTVAILAGIKGVLITGITKRHYVASIFVNDVQWGDGRNSIQIDLVVILGWKGLPYLDVNAVLSNALFVPDTKNLIKKPLPIHEAVISFFSSYVIGGWIKNRYQRKIRRIFCEETEGVFDVLSSCLSKSLVSSLIKNVLFDNRVQLLKILPAIRRSILFKNIVSRPLASLKALVLYFVSELKIRYTPYSVNTICFLGPDGSGKSTVISAVKDEVKGMTKETVCYHLKPQFLKTSGKGGSVTDPHAEPPRGKMLSAMKIIVWLLLYWRDYFFHGHKSHTVRLWDRYYYDLLVDPIRYRYGGPVWLANYVGKLVPKPNLLILLDAPAEVLQKRKQEVSFEETVRQRNAYLALLKGMGNGVVIDASEPLETVVSNTKKVIIECMADRAQKCLY